MRYFIIAAMAIGLVIGCATTTQDRVSSDENLMPPEFQMDGSLDRTAADYYLLKMGESDKRRNTQWWVNYRRALLWHDENPLLACEKFTDLAKDKLFALHDTARLRAWEVCPKDSPLLVGLEAFREKDFQVWLRPLALDVALGRALRDGDQKAVMNYTFEKSKGNLPQEQKVKFTQLALDIATELKDQERMRALRYRLYQLSPRLNPQPREEDFLKVAYDYRKAREFDKAREYYTRVYKSKTSSWEDKRMALDGLRLADKNQRRNEAYVDGSVTLAEFIGKAYKRQRKNPTLAKRYNEALVSLIRAQWTAGQGSAARENITRAQKELRGRYSLSEVFWIRGRMAEEQRNYDEAIIYVDQALKEDPMTAEFKEKLLWYKAWNLRKMNKKDLSVESFVQLKNLTDNDFARSRYTFWLARTLEEIGDHERAKAEFKNLLENDTLGYYGLLAHRELGLKIPAQTTKRMVASADRPKARDLESMLDKSMIEWLLAVGEDDLAQQYLDSTAGSYKRKKDQDQETWLAIFNYYARSGSYLDLFEKLGELPAERRNLILDAHPDLLFPKPYYGTVKAAAEMNRVQLELIYSIMRQESAFNPRARSPADAFGLMQVLPEVARVSAERINIHFGKPEDLFNPTVNIPIGAHHLRELMDMYRGQFIPAIASYNAAHTAIKSWIKTRYQGDAIEFIEDIPYEETRNYVRLVLRNMIFYQLMENNWQPLSFPEWTLKLEHIKDKAS